MRTLAERAALAPSLCTAIPLTAQAPEKKAPSSDLDTFMREALARRDVNRNVLNAHILDEAETFDPRSRTDAAAPNETRIRVDVRDSMYVRSPVRFEGVSVGRGAMPTNGTGSKESGQGTSAGRTRRKKRRKRSRSAATGIAITGSDFPTEPRFVSEAYFNHRPTSSVFLKQTIHIPEASDGLSRNPAGWIECVASKRSDGR